MNRKLINITVIVILAGLVGWGLLDVNGNTTNEEAPNEETTKVENENNVETMEVGIEQGNIAPDFELQTLEGESVKLSDFQGEKVIVNLWATWCPPCRAEMPHMQDYYENYKDDGVNILAVNLTTQERNADDVRPFVYDEFKLTFPVVLDVNGDVGAMYQAFSIPTSYIIDSNGRIGHKVIGPMSYEMMEDMVNSID